MQKSLNSLIILLVLLPLSAVAQNMMVLGNNARAMECYHASNLAVISGSVSNRDIASCNEALNSADLKQKDRVAIFVNRGILHVTLQNYTDAARDYNRAIRISPQEAAAFLNRGNLWLLSKRYEEAIKDYNFSLEYGLSQKHVALLNRGIAYETSNQLVKAQQDYLACLELYPEWQAAISRLERVQRKIKKQ